MLSVNTVFKSLEINQRHRIHGLRLLRAVLLLALLSLTALAQDGPRVTVTPDSGVVEVALMTVLIEGLQPNTDYVVEFVFNDDIVFSSEETSDEAGTITFPAGSTEGDLPGTYTVQVVLAGAVLASADFELTAAEDAGPSGNVTVTPPAGPIGTKHEVKIADLEPQMQYTVEITASDTQQVAYRRNRNSDDDGLIEIELFAEDGDTPGNQAIAVYDGDGELIAQGEFTIDAPPERNVVVDVSPAISAAGDSVNISVTGLAPFDSVSAQVKSKEGVLIDTVLARASSAGDAALTFTGPPDMALGDYDVEIFVDAEKVAESTLTVGDALELVADAALTVAPASATVGSEHMIAASGLLPEGTYTLIIIDPNGAEEYRTSRAADEKGQFSIRISTTPDDDIGVYVVEIRDEAGDTLLTDATLEITEETSDETTADAIASIEPQAAVIGTTHVITVSELDAGETVTIDVRFAGETVYSTAKNADDEGVVMLELVTGAGDQPGDYTIDVLRESGNQPQVILTATLKASAAVAKVAAVGDSQVTEGSLNDGRAEVEFQGERDQYTMITVRSVDFDPAAALFDEDEKEIAFNDDSLGRKTAVIGPLRLPQSGEYDIEVFQSPLLPDPREIEGDFEVRVEPVSVSTAAFDRAIPFSLSPDESALYFELPVQIGDSLTLTVDSNGRLDTLLQVLTPKGYEFAFDDDSGGGFDAEISDLIFDRSGTYILAISTFDDTATGDGTITIARNPARALEDGAAIITLNDKAIRDLVVLDAEEDELLVLNLKKISGNVEDLFVTATVEGMEVMSYSTMGVPDQLPLAFVMPMSGHVVVTLEKFGFDDSISLSVSLERP